ncbi:MULTISPECIES: type II toxin-antitoxin system VapB family antitoxin [unclassified Corynebacterium]|uniref:type II toxin-antitoxin system VapB family antitoxin n=1 Tax=unclassified Corynebacterium TaxID=2624378 RepID=UPI00264E4CD3|nr:type II toxin-antitoxin system VapB family antitoxin [Corynebacterium sp.]
MRTTVTIDDELMDKAAALSGTTERSALLRKGLETYVEIESARRLAALGGTDPQATSAPRRRGGAG